MTTLTYTIDSMSVINSVQSSPDYVTNVFWTAIGKDTINNKTYFGKFKGNTFLNVDDAQPDFIPYDQLTNEIVIGWVMATLGQEGQTTVANMINDQINAQANPTVNPEPAPLPWAGA